MYEKYKDLTTQNNCTGKYDDDAGDDNAHEFQTQQYDPKQQNTGIVFDSPVQADTVEN